jgi:ABC-type phosphate transport system substrate-binding protein
VEGQLIRGAGGEVGLNAYVQWGNGYTYVTDQILSTFTFYYSATEGVTAYDNGTLDFLAIDEPVALNPRYLQVPLLAGGVALTYSISSLAPGAPPLSFSREALARIWLGQVTRWNDPEIGSLNPNASLPDAPIGLTYLPTRGVTQSFVRGLASFIDDVDPVAGDALRASMSLASLQPALNGTAVPLGSTADALQYMAAHDNTLVYLINDGFYTPGLPIANIRNRAGKHTRAPARTHTLLTICGRISVYRQRGSSYRTSVPSGAG